MIKSVTAGMLGAFLGANSCYAADSASFGENAAPRMGSDSLKGGMDVVGGFYASDRSETSDFKYAFGDIAISPSTARSTGAATDPNSSDMFWTHEDRNAMSVYSNLPVPMACLAHQVSVHTFSYAPPGYSSLPFSRKVDFSITDFQLKNSLPDSIANATDAIAWLDQNYESGELNMSYNSYIDSRNEFEQIETGFGSQNLFEQYDRERNGYENPNQLKWTLCLSG